MGEVFDIKTRQRLDQQPKPEVQSGSIMIFNGLELPNSVTDEHIFQAHMAILGTANYTAHLCSNVYAALSIIRELDDTRALIVSMRGKGLHFLNRSEHMLSMPVAVFNDYRAAPGKALENPTWHLLPEQGNQIGSAVTKWLGDVGLAPIPRGK